MDSDALSTQGHRSTPRTTSRSARLPQPLARRRSERSAASHHAIQCATFRHLMTLVADPDRPGESTAVGQLEQRLRARSYRLGLSSSRA